MTFSFSAISATLLHIAIALAVTFHALLYKRSVGAAMAWMGIAWLSPFIGGVLYFTFGINRVKRRAKRLRSERAPLFIVDEAAAGSGPGDPMSPLEHAIGRLTGLPMESGNEVEVLRSGDEAYPAMLAAIDGARMSVGLSTYIFRDDDAGARFIDALVRAVRRGVTVRVLIDGVGSGYFRSGAYLKLLAAGVPVARFLHSYFPWRMPFVNLRNHRKLLVVDGCLGFAGGINIGAENVLALDPPHPVRDTHFRLRGPVIEQLTEAFADDWLFATGEKLLNERWFGSIEPAGTTGARVITSGPDEDIEQIEFAALHAISCARRSIRIVTPYFLPPEILTVALGLAAMRGVAVELHVPEHSNHFLIDWARRVPLRLLLESGCRILLSPAPFEHSKLMVVDDGWSLIGSANWDTRSFRLNFELNIEVHGAEFAGRLAGLMREGRPLTLGELDGESLPFRLRNSAARLLQPYL